MLHKLLISAIWASPLYGTHAAPTQWRSLECVPKECTEYGLSCFGNWVNLFTSCILGTFANMTFAGPYERRGRFLLASMLVSLRPLTRQDDAHPCLKCCPPATGNPIIPSAGHVDWPDRQTQPSDLICMGPGLPWKYTCTDGEVSRCASWVSTNTTDICRSPRT